jgi:hypothetical protein
MASITFNSSVTNHPEITGSFSYDPVAKTLSSNYTLSNNSTLPIASPSCTGNSVNFTVSLNNVNFNFHGGYSSNPSSKISGNCVSGPGGDDDPWAADGI